MNQKMGKLVVGSNYSEEMSQLPDHMKERNKDLFGVSKMTKLGPQDYDPVVP